MPGINRKQSLRRSRLIAGVDRKLAALPREQQNLAAAFAQGLRTGYTLRRSPKNANGRPPR